MPSLIDIRRRVRAVKSTQQITKAMKMVAASRLRRAQERIVSARPFAVETRRVISSLASRVDTSAHPLLDERKTPRAGGKALLIVVSADRGLCGSFNTNVIKAASTFIVENTNRQVALGLVGRRGRDYFARRGFEITFELVNIFAALKFTDAKTIADTAVEAFASGQVDSVHLVYNEFKSVIAQRVVVDQLLPIPRLDLDLPSLVPPKPATNAAGEGGPPRPVTAPAIDYVYEPSPQDLFNRILPRHVEIQVFRALLESNAAFYAAQMTAMDAATRNSADMIEQLTLYMNKVRQAAITREIIEVVSGAGAL
jgi:F-type H+-transporting ATPase subunit gamma